MRAIRLRTEYLNSPLGLGIAQPRFYWNCEGGTKQTAYRIVAKCGSETIWDSGKVSSSAMTHISYKGKSLNSRDIIEWSVTLWDEQDTEGESVSSCFEMGLLNATDWKADWISGNYKPKKNVRYPVDCFKKEFSTSKKIKRARLYASACGVYDVIINGKRIEDFILAPGTTDYFKRIQYQTYDVTAYLCENNKIELRLADGWYRGCIAAYGFTNTYGTQTSVIGQLEIVYEDDSVDTICTDSSWLWSNDGPIRFADLKDGEVYDATLQPSYKSTAQIVSAPKGVELCASNNVYVTEHERFKAKRLSNNVFDFGQNIAGYVKFVVKGTKGQKIKIVLGEVLNESGNVDLKGMQETRPQKGWNQINLIKKLLTNKVSGEAVGTPLQEIIFTCSGNADHYKTSFAVFGFRYAQLDTNIDIDIEAVAVYSDMEQTGHFSCSNELVNKLVSNTMWSMKGNFLDVPTDCPTRERLGWTGDAQIFFDTGAYLMDTASFFKKWLVDMKDSQYANGLIPAVLPFNSKSQLTAAMYRATGSSVGWADAIYLIPYRYYKRYGDKEMLINYWPMMKKYAEYLVTHLGLRDKKEAKANPHNDYTYEKGIHLGEWLEPEEFKDTVYGTKAKHPEECTAYLYYSMTIMAEIADLVGDKDYSHKLKTYANGAKKAYNALFVDTGTLKTNRQAKIVRPLALGLLDGEQKTTAQQLLVQAVENYKYRVGTGFLSTPFILPVLAEAGEIETAYKMLLNTQKPGWLAEVNDGATTIWENWEGNLSQNHYSPGAVCQWLFDTVAGIRIESEGHFVIAPMPGGELSYAEASYNSPYGKVVSRWEKSVDKITYTITIPANTSATVVLPDGERKVDSGNYTYTI